MSNPTIRTVLLICCIALCLPSPRSATAGEPLELGLADFPPYFYLDQQGNPDGAVVPLTAALFAEAGLDYRIRAYPPARLYSRLSQDQTQISIASADHPAMRDSALQGKVPMFNIAINIYHKPEQPPIRQLSDLTGRRVILIGAYTYGALSAALNDPTLHLLQSHASTHRAALQMLLHDRAEYLINYAEPMIGAMRELDPGAIVSDPLAQLDVHIFVARSTPHATELLERLDKALLTLKRRGEIQRILQAADYGS